MSSDCTQTLTVEIPRDQLECVAVEMGARRPSETQLDRDGRGSLALHKEATDTLRAALPQPSESTSPAQSTEVPEAVEAARKALAEGYPYTFTGVSVSPLTFAEVAIAAAAPALLKQGAEEERERLKEALEKLALYRCPHHGVIDGAHYREQEWVAEEGCPLLSADEEPCGQKVERFNPLAALTDNQEPS